MKEKEEENELTPRTLTLSELLRLSRPVAGASSLNHSRPINPKSPSISPSPLSPAQNPNPKTLKSLNHPTVISGTLTLPETSTSSPPNCFLFTDGSAAVPCDVLGFDVGAIGAKIHVLAWNFVPFGSGTGLLEIISWKFANLHKVLSNSDLFPLSIGNLNSSECDVKARYHVRGALESVSPVSVVPCSSGPNCKGSTNVCGFLVNILACDCKSCKTNGSVMGSTRIHTFTSSVIVYFFGYEASSWHPVIVKLIGSVVSLTGLKKKQVFIGEKQSHLMYVTTEKTSLCLPKLLEKWLPVSKAVVKGEGECGSYTGTITEIYKHGMVVELDQKVLLVVTDQLLVLPYSVRIGAMVSVRNVHFVNPNFSWRKILILGACFKTSICLESFSPFETGCCIYAQSQSLLGKFIDLLVYSARLWVLFLVSAFSKKFDGILSEHEILGSKHTTLTVAKCYQKLGLVQSFAASHLPSSVFKSRHGLFIEYCKHDSCCCSKEPSGVQLKLVVPISNFITDCNATWMKILLERNADSEVTYDDEQKTFFFCEGMQYSQPFKSVLGSKELGVALVGQAKISPSSGRLQLIDATGRIDVLITDIPSTWGVNGIYEVNDFTLVMEGVPEQGDRLEISSNESFPCFTDVPCRRAVEVAMYLLYHFSDAKLLDHPCNSLVKDNGSGELQCGSFHMLLVTHKYPFNPKFQGERDITNSSSLFAEAFLLPWDINFLGKDDCRRSTKLSGELLKESIEAYNNGIYQDSVRSKRLKIDQGSSGENQSQSSGENHLHRLDSCSTSAVSYGLQRCTDLSSPVIPCSATYRGINNQSSSSSATIHVSNSIVKVSSDKTPRAQKLLIEFKSESFCKYQLLKVGGYYIIKHHKEDGLCTLNAISGVSCSKVIISSKTHMWSSSFSYDQVHSNGDLCYLPRSVDLIDETFSKCGLQNEPLFSRPDCEFPQNQSDVTIHLSNHDIDFLKENLKRLDESLIKLFVSFKGVTNFSWSNEMTGLVQSPVYSASHYQLPEGNLISLHGKVLSVHNCGYNANSSLKTDFRRGKIFQVAKSVCIHILVDHHLVRIFGSSSNHVYPVGFGPGCSADFHRILVLSGQNKLVMTLSSYIEIKSIRFAAVQKCDSNNLSAPSDLSSPVSLDTIPSILIAEMMQHVDCKPVQFHCRTLAICILLMEKNRKAGYLQTSSHTRSTVFQIPLAGFILDDGTSSSCFWANNEMAITLLRLNEKVPHEMARNTSETEKIKEEGDYNTIIHRVGKIVKKHGFVTVRNYGSICDSTGQDLTLSVTSNTVMNYSDEEFLKRVILHACIGTCWAVVGSTMDSNAVGKLEKQLAEMDMTMHPMQNIWVHEVRHVDPLTEARRVMQDLLNW